MDTRFARNGFGMARHFLRRYAWAQGMCRNRAPRHRQKCEVDRTRRKRERKSKRARAESPNPVARRKAQKTKTPYRPADTGDRRQAVYDEIAGRG
jgi:hypothetical protein